MHSVGKSSARRVGGQGAVIYGGAERRDFEILIAAELNVMGNIVHVEILVDVFQHVEIIVHISNYFLFFLRNIIILNN